MRTLKLTLAYDGSRYAGWQYQPGQATVQGTLEAALAEMTQETIRVRASSRTDAGVHALGQVVGFQTASRLSEPALLRGLNALLPEDMAVREIVPAPAGFHPTRDAIRKRYRYILADHPIRDPFQRAYCWHHRARLEAERMDEAGQVLRGRHDFRSFETAGSPRPDSVRTITHLSVVRGGEGDPDRIRIEVEADGFLYNMVRAIVGTLVEVGRGVRPPQWVDDVLQAARRSAAGPTAPPQGLFLVRVEYPF